MWPDIDGLAPEEVIASTAVATEPSGERVSRFAVAMAAAGAGFVDVAPLHVMTTATLRRLAELDPESTFDVRRYRPNFLLDVDGDGFVENDWVGRVVRIGAVALRVTIPTMRCVMTTLAQPGLGAERSTLRTIAAHNRVEIPGLGTWACAGSYADVVAPGPVRVGDEVVVTGA
ncbi:MAG TPA: MOSC domain-containing protein [Acidimicrobiales bacterium]|nr:MOSC domain-containing protein [Acidimicrobiales bacterium]